MTFGMSRRALIASGASLAGAAWAGLPAPRAMAATGRTRPVRSEPARIGRGGLALRRSVFIPLVGQPFRVAHQHGSLTVILRRVSDLDPSGKTDAEKQFSLVFSDDRLAPLLSQGTYPISHAGRGRVSLFIVPVGPRKTAQQYQAIIDSRPLTAFP